MRSTPTTQPIRSSTRRKDPERAGRQGLRVREGARAGRLEDLKTKNKGNDIEAIKAATDAVQKAFYAISEKLYQQAAPQQGEANNGGAANNGGHDDGVVDADYEEVKD